VQTESGLQILVPTDMLVQQPDGSYYLSLRLVELEHSGSKATSTAWRKKRPLLHTTCLGYHDSRHSDHPAAA